jgi:uncharacterized membrane protein YGL010W
MFVFLDLFFCLGYRPKLYAELRMQVWIRNTLGLRECRYGLGIL